MFTIPEYKFRPQPAKVYQLQSATTEVDCVGCILRCHPTLPREGRKMELQPAIIVHSVNGCLHTTSCKFELDKDDEDWVELSEEQAMEAMLGG